MDEFLEIIEILKRYDAINIKFYEMQKSNTLTKNIIAASAVSKRQTESFVHEMKKKSFLSVRPIISKEQEWSVLIYGSLISIHFVSIGIREYYELDKIWIENGAKNIQLAQ